MNLRKHSLFCILGLIGLSACSTARFYTQAISGQWELLHRAKPVADLLASPKTSPKLRGQLTTVTDILTFADKELHLPTEDQYQRYTALSRPYAVWVVFAAPEFSITPHKWRYPLLGDLSYRGFFREDLARREAEKLRQQGLEIHVAGVDAYSTLGFFRDPLLSTFITHPDSDLAELLFHELTHQRLYLPGDTDFNEAFATALGQEGAKRWLRARGRHAELRQYEKALRIERDFVTLLLQTRSQLGLAYARGPESARREKPILLKKLRQQADDLDARHGHSLKLKRWFEKPVNNARLASISSYYELLPGFERLLQQNDHDLERFFRAVEAMKALSPAERRKKLLAKP